MDFVILSMVLLAIGVYGLLTQRHLVKVFISIELIATAATLNFVMLSSQASREVSQAFLILAFSTDTAVSAVILALLVIVSKKYGTSDISKVVKEEETKQLRLNQMQLTDVSVWLVWVLPLISSVFVPLIGRLSEKARNAFTITITAITAFLAFTLIPVATSGVLNIVVPWIPGNINAGVYIDPLSVLFVCLVSFFGLIIAIYSIGYMKHEQNLTRYYFFLLLFIGSMIGLVVSDNFLQMFIFWEMVGMCSYSLISFWNNRPESVKSGNKVFLMTRIGDISLLAAIGIIFATLGTFSFRGTIDAIIAGQMSEPLLVTVAFLVLGGAIAKSAQLPMHTWLYSAMEAPTSVSALLHAATMVKAGIYLIARFILIAAPMIAALESLWFRPWLG